MNATVYRRCWGEYFSGGVCVRGGALAGVGVGVTVIFDPYENPTFEGKRKKSGVVGGGGGGGGRSDRVCVAVRACGCVFRPRFNWFFF